MWGNGNMLIRKFEGQWFLPQTGDFFSSSGYCSEIAKQHLCKAFPRLHRSELSIKKVKSGKFLKFIKKQTKNKSHWEIKWR